MGSIFSSFLLKLSLFWKQFFCGCCCQEAVEIDSTIKSSSCCLSSNMVHDLHPWTAKERGSVLISWNSKRIWKLFEECPADYGTFLKYQLTQQPNDCDPQCRFKILTMGIMKFDCELRKNPQQRFAWELHFGLHAGWGRHIWELGFNCVVFPLMVTKERENPR